ncbi:MAG: hypothetical protein B9J98_01435 [Candidatus Terraquivivens tikiterensis]|uniref:Thaumarchaeal output domain-containing protein n=1 Tax=Candidatus Terraquivivens tikiterensis TaxID=1980982 RepID=A0A2R7Y986_9ARCH|nr:MAG: hypothetical protein B9J98_01435 [Candidatus Terraquivivens tikiterensis]
MDEESITNKQEVRSLLQKMRDGAIKELSPTVDPKQGLIYPEAEAELKENVQSTLDAIHREGLFLKEQKGNVTACKKCGGTSFMIMYRCPNCNSLSLRKGLVIQHLTCGYTELESVFAENNYICPKCKKRLRALGVDYVKPGIQYVCNECGNITQSPTILLQCWICGELQTIEEANYVEINKYRLDHTKRDLLAKVTFNLAPIVQRVSALGWVAKKGYKLRGKSGVEHTFTLALWPYEYGSKGTPDVVVEIHLGVVEEVQVLSLYAKAIDTEIRNVILAAVPAVSDKAKALAKYYKINIVEAEDTEVLIEKLALAIEDIIKKLLVS